MNEICTPHTSKVKLTLSHSNYFLRHTKLPLVNHKCILEQKIQHPMAMSDSFAPQALYSCCTPCQQCGNETGTYLAILCMDALPNTIYLLVHLCAVVVTLLASSGNSEWDSAWMPSSNTSNFPQSLVRLPWQFLCVPAWRHTWNWFQYPNTLRKQFSFEFH